MEGVYIFQTPLRNHHNQGQSSRICHSVTIVLLTTREYLSSTLPPPRSSKHTAIFASCPRGKIQLAPYGTKYVFPNLRQREFFGSFAPGFVWSRLVGGTNRTELTPRFRGGCLLPSVSVTGHRAANLTLGGWTSRGEVQDVCDGASRVRPWIMYHVHVQIRKHGIY